MCFQHFNILPALMQIYHPKIPQAVSPAGSLISYDHYHSLSVCKGSVSGDRLIYGHSACSDAIDRLPELLDRVIRQPEFLR